ncbi:MAG TPA: hypothetical protein PKL73_05340 [Polyangiaceae bacterium]|nr:MAG: hypothetical protein BWY17_01389 [Deltaproteobacteria bacterium ADurb.Bin207]HNS96357.1 hypothetical protein [Polyangiaceae bacterium]HNZ22927.1 hypothetical protein [Polyangiaceae bacterium]HOD21242.1 hypothetical protein [Polyangiaceae bacterium]HOE49887.1 hypothetical protein [Polyangiaceae bacterium]
MRIVTRILLPITVGAALLAGAACGSTPRPQPTAASTPSIVATPVSNDHFGAALVQVLSDGSTSAERHALLAGVVRRQFARAEERFAAGQPDRALAAVKGALYLVRVGELRLEMLDPSAAKALAGAHDAVAQRGIEGATLAFLRLRAQSLPATDPQQARIRAHIEALEAWMKDTRQKSAVENASADARAFGELAVLEPSLEALEQARAMTDRWISASLDFNASFRPGMGRLNRDQMVEASRAFRAGAIIMAGLYLRHGDAKSATAALERTEARKITSPELFERLQTAASLNDPGAWRDLAALYSKAASEADEEELTVPPEIAEGATWGAALAAYRFAPTQLETAGPLSMLLAAYGMPEAVPLVLAPVARDNPKPEILNTVLRVVAGVMMQEDESRDYPSVQRVFAASHELLALADAVHSSTQLDPSPARLRSMMASLHVRNGALAAARPMFEQSLREEPSLVGYSSLAAVLLQTGDTAGALEAVHQGLRAPNARELPTARAEAHLLAFQAHRAQGARHEAQQDLAHALQDALDARAQARGDLGHASADRILARLAYHYGDLKAWQRAVDRMLERVNLDARVLSMTLIEATSMGLLNHDLRTVHRVLDETIAAADPQDVVYASLWVLLAERAVGDNHDDAVKRALSAIDASHGWVYHLARYGLEEIGDDALRKKAKNLVERAEAEFYIAMRKRVAGESTGDEELRNLAGGPAIDLVETHLARELTQPQTWGPPPKPLP